MQKVRAQHRIPREAVGQRQIVAAKQVHEALYVMRHRGMSAQLRRNGGQRLLRKQPGREQIAAERNAQKPSVAVADAQTGVGEVQRDGTGAIRDAVKPRAYIAGRFRTDFSLHRDDLRRVRRRGRFRRRSVANAADELVQAELLQRGYGGAEIGHCALRQREVDRRVAADGGELLAHARHVRPGGKPFAQLALLVCRVGQHVFKRCIFLQQLHGGLVADARDAGNVIAAVARKPLPVRHLRGGKAVLLQHRFGREAHGLRNALACEHQLRHAVYKLQRVAVAREQQRRCARLHAQTGQRAQQIVRLPALQTVAADVHLVQQRADGGKLLLQLRRGGRSARLVIRVGGVPEGRAMLVKAYGEIANVLLPDDPEQHAQKPVDGVGIHAACVHQGQGVERAVHQRVAIDDQKYITHIEASGSLIFQDTGSIPHLRGRKKRSTEKAAACEDAAAGFDPQVQSTGDQSSFLYSSLISSTEVSRGLPGRQASA